MCPVAEEFKDDLLKAMSMSRKVTNERREFLKPIAEGVPRMYHKHEEDGSCGSTEI